MRARGTVAACVALALLASGCNPNDRAFFREGIGTELYTADVLPATDLQNIYLDQLCRQSSFIAAPFSRAAFRASASGRPPAD